MDARKGRPFRADPRRAVAPALRLGGEVETNDPLGFADRLPEGAGEVGAIRGLHGFRLADGEAETEGLEGLAAGEDGVGGGGHGGGGAHVGLLGASMTMRPFRPESTS